jgi:hypothetical protein
MNKLACLYVGLAILLNCNQYYLKYNGDYGYSDFSIQGKYEVTYSGSENMLVTESKKYAYYRLAELAYNDNVDYIQVLEEYIKNTRKHIKKQSEVRHLEEKDSLGNLKTSTTVIPEIDSVTFKPTITIIAVKVNQNDSGAISIAEIINKAEIDGIKIKKK